MRTFYIFKINKEFAILTKSCPYNLFKSLEDIYYTDEKDISLAYNVYEQLILPLKKNNINLKIFKAYKDNVHYTKFNNIHMINNFYNDEQTKLTINTSYMLLKTTVQSPSFFDILCSYENIFVCDFENKDYFYLEKVLV